MGFKDKINDTIKKAKDAVSSVNGEKIQDAVDKAKEMAGSIDKEKLQDAFSKARKMAGSVDKESVQDTLGKAREMASSINKENLTDAANKLKDIASSPEQLKKFATKKYIGWACGILFVILVGYLFFGGESSEIKMIKNSPLPNNASLTYGNILDKYKYVSDPSWSVITTDRGQKIVQFKAQCSNVIPAISQGDTNKKGFQGEKTINDFAAFLSKNDYNIDLVAQFLLNSSGTDFSLSYLGFMYKGNLSQYSGVPDMIINSLIKNQPIKTLSNAQNYTPEGSQQLVYLLYKFILSFFNTSEREVIAVMKGVTLPNDMLDPLVIYKLSEPKYDNSNRNIEFKVTEKITNLKMEDKSIHVSQLDKSEFRNSKYDVLQEVTYTAGVAKDKGELISYNGTQINFIDPSNNWRVFSIWVEEKEDTIRPYIRNINFAGKIDENVFSNPVFAKYPK